MKSDITDTQIVFNNNETNFEISHHRNNSSNSQIKKEIQQRHTSSSQKKLIITNNKKNSTRNSFRKSALSISKINKKIINANNSANISSISRKNINDTISKYKKNKGLYYSSIIEPESQKKSKIQNKKLYLIKRERFIIII